MQLNILWCQATNMLMSVGCQNLRPAVYQQSGHLMTVDTEFNQSLGFLHVRQDLFSFLRPESKQASHVLWSQVPDPHCCSERL